MTRPDATVTVPRHSLTYVQTAGNMPCIIFVCFIWICWWDMLIHFNQKHQETLSLYHHLEGYPTDFPFNSGNVVSIPGTRKRHAHVHPSRLLMPQSSWWTMSRSIETRATAEPVVCWVDWLILLGKPTGNQGFSLQVKNFFPACRCSLAPILSNSQIEGCWRNVFLRHSMGNKRRIWNPETTNSNH